MKLRITHPAVSYYDQELRVVKFLNTNGKKRVVLQKPDSNNTISLPMSWTDFSRTPEMNAPDCLWADCVHLLALSILINNMKNRDHEQNGDTIGKQEETIKAKCEADDSVRDSREKDLADVDTRTTVRDRRDLRSNSSGSSQDGEGL